MDKKMSLYVLAECKKQIEEMTEEEFEKRKSELKLKQNVYVADSYVSNLINVIMLDIL